MRLAVERRLPGIFRPRLCEIVTPRTSISSIAAAENFLAALSLAEPFSLEIAATRESRWFVARSESPAMQQHAEDQLAAAYPQSDLRPLDIARYPGLDPAHSGPDEQARSCVMLLRAPGYLPLRTFTDSDAPPGTARPDPMAGLLASLGNLPEGWRALSQLVLRPAPDDWCRGYQRLAIEHALAPEQRLSDADTSLTGVYALAGLLAVGLAGFQGYSWYEASEWLKLAALAVGGFGGAGGLLALKGKLGRRQLYDMRLVQDKIEPVAYLAELRLTVFAPADLPAIDLDAQLLRVAAAYRQFSLASGNGFVPRPANTEGRCLSSTAPLLSPSKLPVLNVRELAGLWHLPNGDADVPLLERTSARRYLPLPFALSRGCRIGASRHHGHDVPVALSEEQLRRNMMAVAKTGRGKSTLMELILAHLMAGPSTAGNRPALLVIDPHQDLARDVVGFVPPQREPDVVYLDASNEARPFGLNLIDAGLGWNIDSAVNAALTIFRREFSGNWGPRMESAFRYALRTLYQANEAICAGDPRTGRRRQYTILHVPELLVDPAFRRSVIALTNDPDIPRWWTKYFDTMDRHLQAEVINPVQTKIHKFAGSMVARGIVGQSCSTIDPKSWVASGAVVIVNTAAGTLGEDTAGLLGSVLVNLVSIALAEQAGLDRQQRRRLTLLVDEMHIMPGISYESIVSELAKYGANLILATQSLARLDVVDRDLERALRATLFSNIDGLFVFNVSAEDAAYLVPELGPQVDIDDLVSLPEHHCYVRISVDGDRLPAFSLQLDPPPASHPALRQRLAAASAQRYGRDIDDVEAEYLASFERIDALHQVPDEGGVAKDSPAQSDTPPPDGTSARNQHRKGRRRAEPHQATVPDRQTADDAPSANGHKPEPTGEARSSASRPRRGETRQ